MCQYKPPEGSKPSGGLGKEVKEKKKKDNSQIQLDECNNSKFVRINLSGAFDEF